MLPFFKFSFLVTERSTLQAKNLGKHISIALHGVAELTVARMR